MSTKRLLAIGGFLLIGLGAQAGAQEKSPMKLVTTTPLPGFSGDFDHFGLDLKGKRLFLAAEDHKTVEVFDLDGKHLQSITGFGQPHAMLYMPDVNKLIVTDGGDDFGMVELASGTDYKIENTIKLPNGVDGAVYNPVNHDYYVESGGTEKGGGTHKLNIIDTKEFKLVGDITLPGDHSEAMAITKDGKKMYVNLSTSKEVGVVDLGTHQLTARWAIPAETPNSMALDEPHHRLFIATRKPPKFFAFDTDTGKVVASEDCSPFNDDMWFDTARKRIYLSGSETTTVLAQTDADHYTHVAEVQTGYRAKTTIYVPQLNRFYTAVSGKGKEGAQLAVQVFDVQ